MQACVGTATAVYLFTPGGLALLGSAGQFLTFPGPFSAAATALATQDIYLTLSVTNATPAFLSTMTGGVVTVRIWGGVAQCKSGVSDPSTTAVWNSNYKQVYLLGESTSPYADSTVNALNSSSSTNPTQVWLCLNSCRLGGCKAVAQ
jgi:hypothetical protein